ncbi:hypothetical protein F6U93_13495 [Tamlana haliotis]|uniref:Lipoprotein n=1 Tax=Pseudotamlana haliotis TaxID=2614804 RepID=A0A6N6MCB9_9FLAO|nr:hypothetical protein [Tamlana haliotis]KAB1066863.1 hypothetical protein F6U93_13495 [Tamlana haliotis]
MMRTLLKTALIFCVIVSCKTNGSETKVANDCDLFQIGHYKFYNPRVYEHPVIFEKGNHNLMNKDFTPVWYDGYCAENLPSHFDTKEAYLKYIPTDRINKEGRTSFANFYEVNKNSLKGKPGLYHDDYHLLFRGTVSVKNLKSDQQYLLVAGKNYILKEEDYDKNTEFYEPNVNTMFAYLLEDGVYKSIDIDYVLGNFSKAQHDKVFEVLNVTNLVNSVCVESVNTQGKPNFDSASLPKWVYNKSEISDY